jgi:hypothetical protein
MREFQWVASRFLLQHLRTELTVTLLILLAVIAVTAVFVAVELRKDRDDDHADQ